MKILPVIVLYKCLLSESVTYQTLLKDFQGPIFVYDNSPESHDPGIPDCTYVSDPANSGISKAYNIAAKYAGKHGFDWLMFLDQDTCFPPDSMKVYLDGVESNPNMNLFAPELVVGNGIPFSPAKYIRKQTRKVSLKRNAVYSLSLFSPVNSGILVRVPCFIAAGGYDEKVWLDFSDFVFLERFSTVSNEFFLLDLKIKQSFGEEIPSLCSALNRFRIYMDCLKNCPRHSFMDHFWYFRTALFKTLSQTLQYRSPDFFREFFRYCFR